MKNQDEINNMLASIEADLNDIKGNIEGLKTGRIPKDKTQDVLNKTNDLLIRLKTNVSQLRSALEN